MRAGAVVAARVPSRSRWETFRQRAPLLTLASAGVVLLLGLVAFAFVFKPVTLDLAPGEVLHYKMVTSIADLGADGKPLTPRSDESRLWIIGLPDGDAAVATGPRAVDRVQVVRLDQDGRARLLDVAGRAQEAGPKLGLFDLNLIRLPSDQAARAGRVTVIHSLLPEGRREVQATVKKTKAGPSSEFLLKFPDAVEWLAEDGRYRRLSKLVCTFTVEGMQGRVKQAVVAAGLQVEPLGSAPIQRRLWECRLELVETFRCEDDPRRLRATAGRIAALNAGFAVAESIDGLRSDPVALAPLREGVAAALARVARPATPDRAAWWLLIQSANRADTARLHSAAKAAGFTARPTASGIALGPWPAQDPNHVARVRSRLGVKSEDLRWWRAP